MRLGATGEPPPLVPNVGVPGFARMARLMALWEEVKSARTA